MVQENGSTTYPPHIHAVNYFTVFSFCFSRHYYEFTTLKCTLRNKFTVLTTEFNAWVIFKLYWHNAHWWRIQWRLNKGVFPSNSFFFYFVATQLLLPITPGASSIGSPKFLPQGNSYLLKRATYSENNPSASVAPYIWTKSKSLNTDWKSILTPATKTARYAILVIRCN
jgi:hypothetical protein